MVLASNTVKQNVCVCIGVRVCVVCVYSNCLYLTTTSTPVLSPLPILKPSTFKSTLTPSAKQTNPQSSLFTNHQYHHQYQTINKLLFEIDSVSLSLSLSPLTHNKSEYTTFCVCVCIIYCSNHQFFLSLALYIYCKFSSPAAQVYISYYYHPPTHAHIYIQSTYLNIYTLNLSNFAVIFDSNFINYFISLTLCEHMHDTCSMI